MSRFSLATRRAAEKWARTPPPGALGGTFSLLRWRENSAGKKGYTSRGKVDTRSIHEKGRFSRKAFAMFPRRCRATPRRQHPAGNARLNRPFASAIIRVLPCRPNKSTECRKWPRAIARRPIAWFSRWRRFRSSAVLFSPLAEPAMTESGESIPVASSCCPGGNCGRIQRRDFIKSLAVGAAAAAVPASGDGRAVRGFRGRRSRSRRQEARSRPGSTRSSPRASAKSIAARNSKKSACPSAGFARASFTSAATANSGTGTSSTGRSAPATATTPIPRRPRRPWSKASPWKSLPAARRKSARWIARASPKSPFAASIRSAMSIIAIRNRPSPCRWRPFRLLCRWTRRSSLPATVLRYTIKNTAAKVEVAWPAGSKTPFACLQPRATRPNDATASSGSPGCCSLKATCAPEPAAKPRGPTSRSRISRRRPTKAGRSTGDAFGKGPILRSDIPAYQGDVGGRGGAWSTRTPRPPATASRPRTPAPAPLRARNSRSSGSSSTSGSAAATIRAKRASICWSTARSRERRPAPTTTKCGRRVLRRARAPGQDGPAGNRRQGDRPLGQYRRGPIVFTDRKRRRTTRTTTLAAWPSPCSSRKRADRAAPAVAAGKLPEAAFAAEPADQAEQPTAASSSARSPAR